MIAFIADEIAGLILRRRKADLGEVTPHRLRRVRQRRRVAVVSRMERRCDDDPGIEVDRNVRARKPSGSSHPSSGQSSRRDQSCLSNPRSTLSCPCACGRAGQDHLPMVWRPRSPAPFATASADRSRRCRDARSCAARRLRDNCALAAVRELSRRTIVRSAALASIVEPSTPSRSPFTRPRSTTSFRTQPKGASNNWPRCGAVRISVVRT